MLTAVLETTMAALDKDAKFASVYEIESSGVRWLCYVFPEDTGREAFVAVSCAPAMKVGPAVRIGAVTDDGPDGLRDALKAAITLDVRAEHFSSFQRLRNKIQDVYATAWLRRF